MRLSIATAATGSSPHGRGGSAVAAGVVAEAVLDSASAEARATLLVSGLRGLALNRFVTGDDARTDRAAALLIAAATRPPGAPHDDRR